jgi:hypothetical protein
LETAGSASIFLQVFKAVCDHVDGLKGIGEFVGH